MVVLLRTLSGAAVGQTDEYLSAGKVHPRGGFPLPVYMCTRHDYPPYVLRSIALWSRRFESSPPHLLRSKTCEVSTSCTDYSHKSLSANIPHDTMTYTQQVNHANDSIVTLRSWAYRKSVWTTIFSFYVCFSDSAPNKEANHSYSRGRSVMDWTPLMNHTVVYT